MQIKGNVCSEMKANSSPEMCGAFYVFWGSKICFYFRVSEEQECPWKRKEKKIF